MVNLFIVCLELWSTGPQQFWLDGAIFTCELQIANCCRKGELISSSKL